MFRLILIGFLFVSLTVTATAYYVKHGSSSPQNDALALKGVAKLDDIYEKINNEISGPLNCNSRPHQCWTMSQFTNFFNNCNDTNALPAAKKLGIPALTMYYEKGENKYYGKDITTQDEKKKIESNYHVLETNMTLCAKFIISGYYYQFYNRDYLLAYNSIKERQQNPERCLKC